MFQCRKRHRNRSSIVLTPRRVPTLLILTFLHTTRRPYISNTHLRPTRWLPLGRGARVSVVRLILHHSSNHHTATPGVRACCCVLFLDSMSRPPLPSQKCFAPPHQCTRVLTCLSCPSPPHHDRRGLQRMAYRYLEPIRQDGERTTSRRGG
jgi:hypothetical protein